MGDVVTGEEVAVRERGRPGASVLVVCTANICRSPTAELLLRDALHQRWGAGADAVRVGSAGTRARDRLPIATRSAELLVAHGLDVDGFASRHLDADLVAGADLVLTATQAHRAEVVQLRPAATQYAFGLLELAWLLDEVPAGAVTGEDLPARLRSLLPLARGQRGLRMAQHDLDLPDPIGRRRKVYRAVFDAVQDAVTTVVDRLGAPPADPPPSDVPPRHAGRHRAVTRPGTPPER